ncbi:hypothetical protein FD723_39765 (plasmid) [Nostoc sp. C052]|uniref:hypothetical protein n=1 Tax=Nostoc sp. C052 TaxID=2576902 RepID=UPI0015C379EC|nr:hypothetical protein [Nostoc sp. C052]QLE46350.1 hypothetical protein FD723_39765 [Nostoc sp. C052]
MINMNLGTTNVIKTLVEETFASFQTSKSQLLEVTNVCLEKKNQILAYSHQELLDMSKKSLIQILKMTAAVIITYLCGVETIQAAIALQTFFTVIAGLFMFTIATVVWNTFFVVYGYPLIAWAYKKLQFEDYAAVNIETEDQPTAEIQEEVIPDSDAPAIAMLEKAPLTNVSNNKIKKFANSLQNIEDLRAIADFLNHSANTVIIQYDANTSRPHLVAQLSNHLLAVKAKQEQRFLADFPRD